MSNPNRVHVGRVARAQGLNGLLRLSTFDHDAPSLQTGVTVLLRNSKGVETPHVLRDVKHHAEGILVRLDGVTTRTHAEALINQEVHVPMEGLPELKEGEFWAFNLPGFSVQDEAGKVLGEVTAVLEGKAHDLLTVKTLSGEERDVPMIEHFVLRVDAAQKVVVMRPIPGLLDDDSVGG
jgi:16S rRNA processing protein RimM